MQTKTERIFYWHGIFDPNGLTVEYQSLIQKLIDGDYAGLNLEKLIGHNIYSVRINNADRLLFTTHSIDGIPYLMVLDLVLNHDYAKSRFLKPQVLKNYLELHGQMLSEQLTDAQFKAHEATNPFVSKPEHTTSSFKYARADYYNQQFIELNENQLLTATKKSLPLIVSGVPGSGKSCIALLILAQYIESHPEPEGPILYCCQSEALANHMQQTWDAMPIAQDCKHTVVFKSYEQLILDSLPERKAFVDEKACKEWIREHIIKKRTIDKASKKDSFSPDCDAVYQEFRLLSGSLEAYKKPGKRKFLFQEEAERRWIEEAYTAYQKHLDHIKAIHAPFYSLDTSNQYKLIVADEAQDFSHLQLKLLAELADNQQICYCEDNRQSLSDNKTKLPFLEELLHDWQGKKPDHTVLDKSYRCPHNVAVMANAVSNLKAMVTGNGQLEMIPTNEQSKKGFVKWFDTLSEAECIALQQEANSPDFAIIAPSEYKDEAKTLFKTDLVFTPEEIKGLEYKKIMAYKLFDEKLFEAANKDIAGKSLEISKKTHNRAKQNQGNEQLGTPFNKVYTAFTRSTDTLYIYQEDNPKIRHILNHLKAAIPKETNESTPTTPPSTIEHEAQWFNQVKVLLQQGHEDKAKSIYLNTLGQSETAFEALKTRFVKPVIQNIPSQPVKPKPSNKKADKENIPVKQVTTKSPSTCSGTPKTTLKATTHKTKHKETTIPPKSLATREDMTIMKLLSHFTENKIHDFLRTPHAKRYLFGIPLADGASLFTGIFYTKKHSTTLLNCINIKHYHKFFANNLTEDALCRSFQSLKGPNCNKSVLFELVTTFTGRALLESWLAINPQMAKLVTTEALCRPLGPEAGADENLSPLFFLAAIPGNASLLKTLLTNNPTLTQTIPAEALCLALTAKAEGEANESPLLRLTSTLGGIELLALLIEKNPTLAQNIHAHALCLGLTEKDKSSVNLSPFFFLSKVKEGIALLKKLFELNPQLVQTITGEDLCQVISPENQLNPNSSILHELTKNTESLDWFKTLIDANPKIAETITAEAFFLIANNTGKSPCFFLTQSKTGKAILNTIMENNPKIAQLINDDDNLVLCNTVNANSFFAQPNNITEQEESTLEPSL